MAFADSASSAGIELLQRSLDRGRLGHAYLFAGNQLEELETVARNLAKTLNCREPRHGAAGVPVDCCDRCVNCRRADDGNFPDVFVVRPESKSRQLRIQQFARRPDSPPMVMNEFIHLKPYEGGYKVGLVVAADRMNDAAANAFLKTLEEPPAKSVLILLTTEPQRILETIQSRCLRLTFGAGERRLDAAQLAWVETFSRTAAAQKEGLLPRYQLLGKLLAALAACRESIEARLGAASPLEQHTEADPRLREQWELELRAAVESEYRRERGELLAALQCWLRDVWLRTFGADESLRGVPEFAPEADVIGGRISTRQALENLTIIEDTTRLLHTNVQESLALEVGLLKLSL